MTVETPSGWTGAFSIFAPRANSPSTADYRLVRRTREIGATLRPLDSEQLRRRTARLRSCVAERHSSINDESVVAEAFALVNDSARRSLGIEYYDVQLLAGRALVNGGIAEMATGEGKTFVQALAATVFALNGRGVHVMTSNAYLAERDYRQLSPVLGHLGLTSGWLDSKAGPAAKRSAYLADVTFGAGYEFGFDYLRDQVSQLRRQRPALGETHRQLIHGCQPPNAEQVQRGHEYAIIDEVDSVLIDEAAMPLILSSGTKQQAKGAEAYVQAARLADVLQIGADFVVDVAQRWAKLTQRGMRTILDKQQPSRAMHLERPWPVYVEQALFAKYLLRRDVDYVVVEDRVVLVDQCTGRLFADRSLRNGLHQAVEANEGVPITSTRAILGRISRQQIYRLYHTICGMTGTARESEREFWEIYRLKVVLIPPRNPCQRIVFPTRFFAAKELKRAAIVEQIEQRYDVGQPVLVGTHTIEESRRIAKLLDNRQIQYQLLNGTQDASEAQIVEQAGQKHALTIATNIAGRGTDIRLGDGVREIGGLHVIATEPHRSIRVDRQLVGRAARQGDPGSCQMFVSADDEILRLHASRLARKIRRLSNAGGEILTDLSAEIARVQRRVERLSYEQRHRMLCHDQWMENVMAKLVDDS